MHAPIVVVDIFVVVHVGRLGVLTDDGVVVGGARCLRRPDALAVDVGCKELRPDEPVRLIRGLSQVALLDERAEHIRETLV